ncbi:hypothetical protein DFP72DRAFT_877407, partial [Ephemerocybe angulata]
MPDYVYALHDFLPEHEDEVSFRAGERIEVIEKDDLYGDGWWQGRNLAGKVGLFPQSYTTPAPPAASDAPVASTSNGDAPTIPGGKTTLQTLTEESEGESPTQPAIASPVPKPPLATFLNGNGSDHELESGEGTATGDGEMMKATLTDVQKAIEQLGRNRVDGDGGRSFSFASTQDGGTESDFDMSDTENLEDTGTEGEDWHKGARQKLAEKARKAIAEAERLEEMMGNNAGERRSTAPPIDVELSDESDEEGDMHDHDRQDFTSSSFQRMHPHIPEEDEDEIVSSPADFEARQRLSQQQAELAAAATAPPQPTASATPAFSQQEPPTITREETEVPTATRETFSEAPASPLPIPHAFIPQVIEKSATAPVFYPPSIPSSPPPQENGIAFTPIPPVENKRNSAPTPAANNIPSPIASTHTSAFAPFEGTSVSSSTPSISTNPTSAAPTGATEEKKDGKHPNDWTVDEVVDWLRGRGFDQDVCDKFTEQEITGDVLLELDVNVLKSEIGILAFGKRMRIANAIQELRRPPSVSSYEARNDLHTPSSIIHQPLVHSRSVSQSQSHHSFPGTPSYLQHAQSVHSSLGSPMGYSMSSNGIYGAPSEVPQMNGGGLPPSATVGAVPSAAGLGIDSNGKAAKGRPSQLTLSPSDGALKDKVIIERPSIQTPDEDRAHMSDGEVVASSTSVRRRLFGRSQDSSSLSIGGNSRHSRDGLSLAPSSSTKDTSEREKKDDKEKDKAAPSIHTVGSRHRTKKSMDGKSNDRLSIFGTTFGGSLSKGRKPPPSEDTVGDGKSGSVFSRLGGSSIRKASSHRPSTPNSPKSSPIEAKDKSRNVSNATVVGGPAPRPPIMEPVSLSEKPAERTSGERHTLRKRASSGPVSPVAAVAAADPTGNIKSGVSILEQVGTPDHTGWMRKKAVRYNTWKPRYFVLKGEHLYILRSNNKSETRLKGYINIRGYRVTVDETLDPGRYCFRIDHDHDKTHFFSSEEKSVIREWMKAIMKATIGRDYTKPVVSSCNIPTIPLIVAQTMNPAPRPPSPGARDATQKALRRENPNQLSSRDARVLMGLPNTGDSAKDERKGVQNFFAEDVAANGSASTVTTPKASVAPPRPSREMRRGNSTRSTVRSVTSAADESLIDWGNSHLPHSLQVSDTLFGGLALLRIAESIKGKPASPPVPDSAFPVDPTDDKLDGLFRLFDYLLDNDVKMGSVSINDVRQGKRDKIFQLLRALKAWEDKRRALASMASSVTAGSFMAPVQYVG